MEKEQFKVGNWVVVTQGGYGTYPENIGCKGKIVEISGNYAKINTEFFVQKDHATNHNIKDVALKLAENHEIPEKYRENVDLINQFIIF